MSGLPMDTITQIVIVEVYQVRLMLGFIYCHKRLIIFFPQRKVKRIKGTRPLQFYLISEPCGDAFLL